MRSRYLPCTPVVVAPDADEVALMSRGLRKSVIGNPCVSQVPFFPSRENQSLASIAERDIGVVVMHIGLQSEVISDAVDITAADHQVDAVACTALAQCRCVSLFQTDIFIERTLPVSRRVLVVPIPPDIDHVLRRCSHCGEFPPLLMSEWLLPWV